MGKKRSGEKLKGSTKVRSRLPKFIPPVPTDVPPMIRAYRRCFFGAKNQCRGTTPKQLEPEEDNEEDDEEDDEGDEEDGDDVREGQQPVREGQQQI